MPDISMCASSRCPVARRCYRSPESGSTPDELQSWMGFEPDRGTECRGFWPISEPDDG
jgi:hypothetical protein